MPDVLFHGGSCDGKTVSVDDVQAASGNAICNGQQYNVFELRGGEWLALPLGVDPPAGAVSGPGTGSGSSGVLSTSTALTGWNGMIRALSRGLPAGLNRAERARRLIRSVR